MLLFLHTLAHGHDIELMSALCDYPSCMIREPDHAQGSVYSNGAMLRKKFEDLVG